MQSTLCLTLSSLTQFLPDAHVHIHNSFSRYAHMRTGWELGEGVNCVITYFGGGGTEFFFHTAQTITRQYTDSESGGLDKMEPSEV